MGRTGITGAVGEDLRALAAALGGWEWPGIAQQVRGEVGCAGPGCGCSSCYCPFAINPVPTGRLVSRESLPAPRKHPGMGMESQTSGGTRSASRSFCRERSQSFAVGVLVEITAIPPGMGQLSPILVCPAALRLLTELLWLSWCATGWTPGLDVQPVDVTVCR